MDRRPDISFVMPCLNEQGTVGGCTDEAFAFIKSHSLSGEVIIADNGSTDGSADIARSHGARVVNVPRRGYGNAIRAGMAHSHGKVIVIGDCDSTYDFLHVERFYYPLAKGICDAVIGDRTGKVEKGAMPLTHRLGAPILSLCGRIRFKVNIRDFHCGLRSVTREAAKKMRLRTQGMEFATEFIAAAKREGLRIGQTPAVLRRCRCERKSKLRTVPDGFRHLLYILFSDYPQRH